MPRDGSRWMFAQEGPLIQCLWEIAMSNARPDAKIDIDKVLANFVFRLTIRLIGQLYLQ